MTSTPTREVTVAVLAALALTVGLDLLGLWVPLVRANLVALFAVVFLYVPQWTLPSKGPGTSEYGLTWTGFGRGARWGILFAAVTLVGFLPGHHLWSTVVLQAELHVDAGAYVRPDDRNHGDPAEVDDGRLHAFHRYDVQYVAWTPSSGPWSVTVETDGTLWRPDHARIGARLRSFGEEARPVLLSWRTTGGSEVRISATEADEPLARDRYALGPGSTSPRDRDWSDGGLRLSLSALWLPLSIVFQLLLIALPEEFFYRGYLQRRLDETHGRRAWRLGPVELTRSNLVVSLLFALGHFVIGFDPWRLAVFFPSLVFGWLRDRTDGIAAPVVYHAACNLMVQVVAVHYW